MLMSVLAWRPFLDPVDAHRWWFVLLIPVALGVALGYKAVRTTDLKRYVPEVLTMTVQIVLGMVGLAAASFVLVEVYARWMTG